MPDDIEVPQGNPVADVNDAVTSQIGRTVAFIVTPLLLPIVGIGTAWLQDAIGIDLDPAVVVGVVGAIVAGIAIVIWKWIGNRGEYERAVVELERLYEMGNQNLEAYAAREPIPPEPRP